ncbi:kinase-like domain-containing protein [Protomyces lactucae-debilis]|uniref:Kinase-like domain-containing protein n=1 Tax=Protomyces lactucae-debilis TaxID=2754530 RepID=A0A1Y2F9P0_PROLT|nr:kinase-like domain-containing protein [Protomyces lactucae-debilis]ORY80046.1 kinase-like domain-containing protein [Protomyces lactucae-debilis]
MNIGTPAPISDAKQPRLIDLPDWQRANSYGSKSDPGAMSPGRTQGASPYKSPRKSPQLGLGGAGSPRLQPLTMREPQQPANDRFRRVSEIGLRPRCNSQPPLRRANPDGGYLSPLQAATTHLLQTYRICNPNFNYLSSRNPRRVLTKPSEGTKNEGFDNDDSDYILYVNDILGINEGHKYLILDVLGQGTFGQVVKCQNMKTLEVVAVKVIKNKTAYFNQSMMEVTILDLLNNKLDAKDEHHILRLKDTFIHRHHLCLVFELLSVNLYELIKQNQFRGLSINLVKVFSGQLLDAMTVLNEANIIHCDLKPENILLKNLETPNIKVIDFGSACHERQTVYTYIQSRFYRSPEVLLGLPYSAAIDIWSLGCIVAELFLGLPLFPGSSEYNQMTRITEMLGQPPAWMLEMGKQSGEFFEKSVETDAAGKKRYRLKSLEQYSREHGVTEQPSKRYFQETTLQQIIARYPLPRKNMTDKEKHKEEITRNAFVDFVGGLLNLNPLERWSPQQAKMHPFITGAEFRGSFVPPMYRPIKRPSAENPLPPPPSHHNQAPQQKAAEQLIASQAIAHEQAEARIAQKQAQQQQAAAEQHAQQAAAQAAVLAAQQQAQHAAQQQQQIQQQAYMNSNPYEQNPYLQSSQYAYHPGSPQYERFPGRHSYSQQSPSAASPTMQYYPQGMQQPPPLHLNVPQQHHGQYPQQQQQQTFGQRRARAGTMGNIEVPVNLQRQAQMMNPQVLGNANYGWQGAMQVAQPNNYMGQGQGSGDNRRGSIHQPMDGERRMDDPNLNYLERWL